MFRCYWRRLIRVTLSVKTVKSSGDDRRRSLRPSRLAAHPKWYICCITPPFSPAAACCPSSSSPARKPPASLVGRWLALHQMIDELLQPLLLSLPQPKEGQTKHQPAHPPHAGRLNHDRPF